MAEKRKSYDLNYALPWALAFQFAGLVVLIGLFASGELGKGAIPKQYYAAPWSGEAVTNVMGLEVNDPGTFLAVFFVMLALSLVSALNARAMSIWEWEMVNFSNLNRGVNEYKSRWLWVVSLCGTFFLSITTVVNLFFSVTSLYYLLAAAIGRVAATLILNWVTAKLRKDAASGSDSENVATKMFRKHS